ncbi:hypothetical protein CDAR_588751 [Caerostris darwini]|uniref:Uncharacterized protein n=1 Tax=Caerostris darwini TaxID=1538125 RepID=A0AAV4UV34_9ARAC|nr:hypothetical protein CDAR_588751 [Caerostris darwini]
MLIIGKQDFIGVFRLEIMKRFKAKVLYEELQSVDLVKKFPIIRYSAEAEYFAETAAKEMFKCGIV